MARTGLFSRVQPGGVFDYVSIFNVQGDAWFVDSGHASASDAAGYGQNPDAPCATWDYAIGLATANNGDVIFLMPGHAENLASATAVAMDKAGIRVIGLGQGADRPTFTATAQAGCIAVSAASCWIENIILTNTGTVNFSNGITVTAADCTLKDVEIRDSAADSEFVVGILTDTNANRLHVEGLNYIGNVSGDAAATVIRCIGADDVRIRDCSFHGNWSVAGVGIVTTACLDLQVDGCYFYESGTTDLSLNVVNTGGTASTWYARNCYDGAAGKSFSGGSGGAIAGDDIGTVSGAVSTVNSIVTTASAGVSTNTSFLTILSTSVKTVSQGVSTNASILTGTSGGVSSATSTMLVTSAGVSTVSSIVTTASAGISTNTSIATTASAGVSTNTSFLTVLSTSVKTVSQGVSTNASILTGTSGGVSSATSTLLVTSAGVSTVSSVVTTASAGVSTVSSIVTNVSTCATATSGGVSTNTSFMTAMSTNIAALSAQLSIIYSKVVSGW